MSNIFITKMSTLGSNWSPRYHDFTFILNTLEQTLKDKGPEHFIHKIQTIKNDSIYLNSKTYKIHPELSVRLKSIFKQYF